MKILKQLFATILLTLVLSASAYAGDMSGPSAPAPAPGDMGGPTLLVIILGVLAGH